MSFSPQISKIRTLLNSFLALGAFFVLGTASAFAVTGDFNVTGANQLGGDPSIPNVGAPSELLSTVVIASNGGDDFADTENFTIEINTLDYPSLVFDTTVTNVTIGGTFGAIGSPVVTYNGAKTQATFTLLTGGGDDLNGETITVSNLKISSTYAMPATVNKALIAVDANTTSNNSFRQTTQTLSQAVLTGPLSSTNVTPASNSIAATGNVAISLTSTLSLPAQAKILITFPSGFDLSSFGTSQIPTNATGITAANWTATRSGQIITMTENNIGTTPIGAISFTLANIKNPDSTGSTGNYTVKTTIFAGNEMQQSTAVPATTIVGSSSTYTVGTPEGVELVNQDEAVVLTWTDPDDDTTHIQILKGTDPLPVDGSVYATVAVGEEMFIDTDVEEGDVVTYQLRATGNGRTGTVTEELSITVSFEDTTSDDTSDDSSDDSSDDTTDDTSDDSSDDSSDDITDDTSTEDTEVSIVFSDISGHWGQNAIEVMTAALVVEGNPDGTFLPNAYLNRAEAAALLWRVVSGGEAPDDINADPYQDVDISAWYAAYITGLKDLELVEGNPNGTFQPSEEINRAEFLQMALNVYLYLNPDMQADADVLMEGTVTDVFGDLDTDSWYAGVVTVATEWDFIHGSVCSDDKCFYAGNSITRAEATTVLYNMFADNY